MIGTWQVSPADVRDSPILASDKEAIRKQIKAMLKETPKAILRLLEQTLQRAEEEFREEESIGDAETIL